MSQLYADGSTIFQSDTTARVRASSTVTSIVSWCALPISQMRPQRLPHAKDEQRRIARRPRQELTPKQSRRRIGNAEGCHLRASARIVRRKNVLRQPYHQRIRLRSGRHGRSERCEADHKTTRVCHVPRCRAGCGWQQAGAADLARKPAAPELARRQMDWPRHTNEFPMNKNRLCAILVLLPLITGCASARGRGSSPTIPIVIETEYGNIEAELDSVRAPITVTNFLRYVDAKLFDGATFFRAVRMDNQPTDSVKIEVIQASIPRENAQRGFPAIPLERTSVTGISHKDGTLSMARSGPNTATSSFSIMINDQPQLDFGGKRQPDGQGFAAFGRVISGMDIARRIQQQPVTQQRLQTPVRILRIIRK